MGSFFAAILNLILVQRKEMGENAGLTIYFSY